MYKYFDSCLYVNDYENNTLIKLKRKCKSYNCKGGILNIKNYKTKEIKDIKKRCLNDNFFFPTFHFKKKIKIETQIKNFKKNNIRIVKVHPRFLNLDIKKDYKKFEKIFRMCEKNKINIMFCSFSSFENKILDYSYLDYLCKLINLAKHIKIIIMHGGGVNLIQFYERLRFNKNVILDLSYTCQHFLNTSLFQDIKFLINKFDKKLVIGTDYPSKDFISTKKFIKKIKKLTTREKFNNITFRNIENFINEI